MTDPGGLRRALIAVADAFDAVGARWAIGGSLASAVHGEPRATNDIDVIAVLDTASARLFASRLGTTPTPTPPPPPRAVTAVST